MRFSRFQASPTSWLRTPPWFAGLQIRSLPYASAVKSTFPLVFSPPAQLPYGLRDGLTARLLPESQESHGRSVHARLSPPLHRDSSPQRGWSHSPLSPADH